MWTFIILAFATVATILDIVAACHALLHKRDPQAALGWIAFIVLVPYIGILAYLLFGVGRVDSRAQNLMEKAAIRQTEADLLIARDILKVMEPSAELPPLSVVGYNVTGQDLLTGNSITLLENGEEAYPVMLEAIENAKSHVYLSTYIFKAGTTGDQFAEALARAASRGVDTRLLIDGMGAIIYTRRKPWKHLPKAGVRVEFFLPPKLFPPTLNLNLRTHRKILVVDGITAFTGGMNISHYHNAHSQSSHAIKDIHFLLEGPVTALLQEAFLMDWAFVTGESTVSPTQTPPPKGDPRCPRGFVGRGKGKRGILDLLCGMVNGAKRSVRIMTPYFLPPRELMNALSSAVLRGVEVQVILPAKNNLFFVHYASSHIQPRLIEQGIRIFWQPAPFAHTKLFMVDDEYTLIGSANLDPRSLFLNFELNVEVWSKSFSTAMREYFDSYRYISAEFTLADYQKRSLAARIRDGAFWLASPYL